MGKISKYEKDLCIGYLNIDGLFYRNGNQWTCKLNEPDIAIKLQNFDLICLVGTHCGYQGSFSFPGYHIVQNIRPKSGKATKHIGVLAILI